jgi:hypothetical protein
MEAFPNAGRGNNQVSKKTGHGCVGSDTVFEKKAEGTATV